MISDQVWLKQMCTATEASERLLYRNIELYVKFHLAVCRNRDAESTCDYKTACARGILEKTKVYISCTAAQLDLTAHLFFAAFYV